jgi:hypothetical protein
MRRPYEKLRALPQTHRHLKPGTTVKPLDAMTNECSDTDAVHRLNEARTKLFQLINNAQPEQHLTGAPSFRLMPGLGNTDARTDAQGEQAD